jgi:MHS family proline/betaine transporter-like MFS transporter
MDTISGMGNAKKPVTSKKLRNVVTSCMIGNALEWYDFALHGFFATMIGKVIFPPDQSPIGLLLKSYAVFFLGFIMRPLGAVIFGYIGDRHGRKKALMWSIYCMAIPTTLIGCLPTYSQVGAWSAVILVVLRLFQGLSMGGEFTGSMIFVVEHAPEGRKGFWGSWSSLSVLIGLLFGSIFGTIISTVLSAEALETWGWRLPFLLSFAGSWVGSSLRKATDESPSETPSDNASPTKGKSSMLLGRLFSGYWRDMLRVVVIDVVVAVGFFLVSIYIMGYVQNFSGQSYQFSVMTNTLSMLLFAATIPLAGWLSDRWGPIQVMQGASVILGGLSVPCFWGLSTGIPWVIIISHGLLAAAMGGVFAPVPALMVSIFPAQVRYSGVSIAHNISMAIFGGSAPEVATYLIGVTGNNMMPGLFLAAASLISWLGLSNLRASRLVKGHQKV